VNAQLPARIAHGPSAEDLAGWLRAWVLVDPDVVGVGLGRPDRGGRLRRGLAVVVLVRRKVGAPPVPVPSTLFQLPTDVVELVAPPPSARKSSPVPPGKGQGGRKVAIPGRPFGTLGCVVRDAEDGARLLLANAHVLVPASAAVGETHEAAETGVHVPVFDGSPLTRGRAVVGRLARHVPFVPASDGLNVLDAAVAEVTGEVADGIAGIGPVGPRVAPALGQPVRKVGAVSAAISEGTVRLVRTALLLRTRDYGTADDAEGFLFADQILCDLDQPGGDSGSVVVDLRGRAVGLAHARVGARFALVAPAEHVERKLGVRFGDAAWDEASRAAPAHPADGAGGAWRRDEVAA
jgi:hypothetical protein